MFKRVLSTICLATGLLSPMPANAEKTLIFATALPETSRISSELHSEWAAQVNNDGRGVLQIDLRHGYTLANPANVYDRVKGGVVPIGWAVLSMVGGRFPLAGMMELPFLTDDPVVDSVAFWRLYKEGYLDKEFNDIVPLYLMVFPNLGIHLNRPLPKLDDLDGARVIVGSKPMGQLIDALGGVPLSIGIADAYEAIRRGTADGEVIPWSAFRPFKMSEITSYHIDAPLGTSVLMAFISRKVWNKLSEKERNVLMLNSGENQTRKAAEFAIRYNSDERNNVAALGGHEIVSPNAGQLNIWQEAASSIVDQRIKETKGGAELLIRFKELQAEVSAEFAKE